MLLRTLAATSGECSPDGKVRSTHSGAKRMRKSVREEVQYDSKHQAALTRIMHVTMKSLMKHQ
jgi:fatty acid-binding protein DegV